MSQSKKTTTDFIARFKAPDAGEGRPGAFAKSAPKSAPGDFDDYLASWVSFTGAKVGAPLIGRLLSGADEGMASELAALFQTILEKEPVAAAHLQTRVLSVLSCDWSVQGEDPAKAREAERLLRDAKMHSLLRHLLDAIGTGYSGAAVLWGEGGSSIRGFKPVHPTNWTFDLLGNPGLLTRSGVERPLASYHPFQFVFHTHSLKPGIPSRGGLLRSLVWLYFFKHYAMRDQARYLERFGMPFVLAKIRREDFDDSGVRSGILDSLAKVGSDGVAVVTEGSELQVVNGASASSADYKGWLEYIDEVFALLILGQTASSGKASGLSRGQMQENVRRDIIEADCRSLMETVDSQLLGPLEECLYGTRGTLRFKLDYSSPESLTERAQVLKSLSEAGFQADPAWVERSFGIQLRREQNPSEKVNA